MYVDDILGVCMLKDLESDLLLTCETCTDLLGPTAVADDKTETGRRLDVIGYIVDLDLQRVLIARKNLEHAPQLRKCQPAGTNESVHCEKISVLGEPLRQDMPRDATVPRRAESRPSLYRQRPQSRSSAGWACYA